MSNRTYLARFAILLAAAALWPAAASGRACVTGSRPAATLLFPYFEVDPAAGRTTLVSIGNVSDEPALAQVVVWSNCAVPVLDFTLYLAGGAVQPLELTTVLLGGKIPATGPGDGSTPFPNCGNPVSRPDLDAAERARLRARLAGQPDPVDGLCYALPGADSPALVGYLTVDVLNDCSETVRTPRDDGYFVDGGLGVAGNRNVLWGDFFFVDQNGDTAEGSEAISVVAAASDRASFYGLGSDNRLPLGSRYRTRFLNGGGFDAGTEIILWTQLTELYPGALFEPPCEYCPMALSVVAAVRARDEQGAAIGGEDVWLHSAPVKHRVGSEALPVEGPFGSLDFNFEIYCGICSPPFLGPAQSVVLPLYSAAGRFGVGLNAVRTDAPCQ